MLDCGRVRALQLLAACAGRARLRQQLAQRQQALRLRGAARRQRHERRCSVHRCGLRVDWRARRRRGRGRSARVTCRRGAVRRGLRRRRVHGRVARARAAAAARTALAGAGRRGCGRALAPEHKAVHLHHLVCCVRAEPAAQDPAVRFPAAVSSAEAAAPLVTRLITSCGGGACAGSRVRATEAAAGLPDAGALARTGRAPRCQSG